ncbi:VPLPA-CTERM sorting domain-containing protein [Methylomonas methanica]|uniref:Secreted protein n=1 Tax=Methylomonas methanica (strain DSM 25384 / MC09) TaxID=857087 RepID=G0A6C1_METMM|nr:VPLPA-CTERM sorting domain-containing protein [Methylomonas methanica]AEG01749.1 protein of unknown function DUF1555 [Methylomonas methanica MC09]
MKIVLSKLCHVALAVALFVAAQTAVASNALFLSPAEQTVDVSAGMVSLDLWMDFDDPTLGGGIDLTLNGPLAFAGFTPSDFFLNDADESFSGHSGPEGTADNDYEIHFGDFSGLSGLNVLGTIEVSLTGAGSGVIDLAINSTWGEFFNATTLAVQDVNLSGASVQITAVPLPAAIWFFAGGLGLLVTRRRR